MTSTSTRRAAHECAHRSMPDRHRTHRLLDEERSVAETLFWTLATASGQAHHMIRNEQMKQGITCSTVRWMHIVLSIPIIGYIYSPFEAIPQHAPVTRLVFLPHMVLSGLLMWKGHAIRRLFRHEGNR
jgi:hypothetical protein